LLLLFVLADPPSFRMPLERRKANCDSLWRRCRSARLKVWDAAADPGVGRASLPSVSLLAHTTSVSVSAAAASVSAESAGDGSESASTDDSPPPVLASARSSAAGGGAGGVSPAMESLEDIMTVVSAVGARPTSSHSE